MGIAPSQAICRRHPRALAWSTRGRSGRTICGLAYLPPECFFFDVRQEKRGQAKALTEICAVGRELVIAIRPVIPGRKVPVRGMIIECRQAKLLETV